MAKSKKVDVKDIEVVDPIVVDTTAEEVQDEPGVEESLAEELFPKIEAEIDLDAFATNEMVAAIARFRNKKDNGEELKKLINSTIV